MAAGKKRAVPMINTAREAIEALGGVKVVAAWLGTSPDNVMMMRHRGYVARGYHLHFYVTLQERGYRLAPSLFGLDTFDHLIMPKLRGRKKPGSQLERVA
jgi:hypothetical protein